MENPVKTLPVLACAALVFCAAALTHAPALSGSPLWDDAVLLSEGSFASDCRNLPAALSPVNLVRVLPVPMSARPVVNATLIADACSGAGPFGLRLTNLLLHACGSTLLFLLVLTLSGALWPSLAAGLLFAVHPAAAEAVNVAVFRSHLLGFFFFACSLLAAVHYARRPGAARAAAAALCALLGMLSVETAAVLPAAAAAAVYFDSGREGLRRSLRLFAALLLLTGFYAWFRAPRAGYSIEGVAAPGIAAPAAAYPRALFPPAGAAGRPAPAMPWTPVYTDREANLFTMGGVLTSYISEMAFPAALNTDYSPPVRRFSAAGLALLAVPLAFALAGGWLLYRRELAGLGITLAVITLAPAWNLLPIYNIKADRYLYLPLAGAAIVAAALLARAARHKVLSAAAGLLALAWFLGFAKLTLRRAPAFADDVAFFSEAVKRDPGVPRARANLSAALLAAGDRDGALREAAEAARLAPGSAGFTLRLAYALAWCGRTSEARAEAREALRLSPRNADALYLAGLLELKRDRAAGRALLERALAAAPGHREARLTLLLLEKKKGPGLSPGDKADLEALTALYRTAGLSF